MIEAAINKIQRAIEMAKRVGAWEIVEELKPLEESLMRRKCRIDMEFNGMTGYCLPGCCNAWGECSKENGFGIDGETIQCQKAEKPSAAQADMMDHRRNWFGNTGDQPSEPIRATG